LAHNKRVIASCQRIHAFFFSSFCWSAEEHTENAFYDDISLLRLDAKELHADLTTEIN
jgi:hypothetical protein